MLLGSAWAALAQQGDARRGQYLSKAAGCVGCHTEERDNAQPFAGGRALKTPFGTFYGPNITPHPRAGIGRWTEQDFIRALREGRRPDGAHYFPAFPYPSFTRINDQDLRDLWAYLRGAAAEQPRERAARARSFPSAGAGWSGCGSSLLQSGSVRRPIRRRAPQLNRGSYLVNALGHCGECHTPRNFLGGMKRSRHLAGAKLGEGTSAANLTPTRLKKKDDAEVKDFLQTGMTPDGDVAAESMAEVVRNTTSQLTTADLDAVLAYLRSLPPLPDEPK